MILPRLASGKRLQCGLHLVACMSISGFLRDDDPIAERLFCFGNFPEAGEQLAVLKISRDVRGMRFDQRAEVLIGGLIITQLGALNCKAIAGKRVVWVSLDETLENFAARLLCLRHRIDTIIASLLVLRNAQLGRNVAAPGAETPI